MTAEKGQWIKSTCAYCGVGCGIEARVCPDGLLEVRGDKTHPANQGRLCSKGLALGETLVSKGRLLHPVIKGQQATWGDALNTVADRLKRTIADHGPEAVAFYVSGQLLTEDYYVANKLMKGFLGSANIDTNSRLCMSSSVAGHTRAFGSDTVPGCYEDLELADLVVLVGSNLAWCHPVLYQRLKAAKQQSPHMKLVVVDPRRTDTCDIADLHLPLQPGTDVVLFNGLLAYLVTHGHVDQDYISQHTEGFFDALPVAMREVNQLRDLAQQLSLSEGDLEDFFRWFAETEKTVTVYSQGVNQSTQGTNKVNSIINCHLATGRIGKPGSGPFSVTGQPNAMGGREVGGLANTLAAHMDFSQPKNVQRVKDFWQAANMATQPGLKAVDLFNAVAEGKVKFLWIMATNPLVSMPDADRVKHALEACPTVVVSDCIADTDTTRCATITLPAAGWGEKSGTVTNSERRISRQRALLPLSGEAKPDWWIISKVAKRLGFGHAFDYTSEHDIFVEYARLTGLGNNGSRDLDISGLADISRAEYDALEPLQWPVTEKPRNNNEAKPFKRFFANGGFYTPTGKACFVPTPWNAPATSLSDDYPLLLNTGRIRDQWHTMTRTGLAVRLNSHLPEPFVTVHPKDAGRYGLNAQSLADITSPQGSARLRVQVSDEVQPGQVFVPMHWSRILSSRGVAGALVAPNVDAISGQPELKHTPVAIAAWRCASEARLVSRQRLGAALDTLEPVGYWAEQGVAGGYAYYVASEQQPQVLEPALLALRPQGMAFELLNFSNPGSGEYRSAVGDADRLLFASVVAGKLADRDLEWLAGLLDETFNSNTRQAIIKGQATGALATGKIVCACHQVGRNSICQAIRDGDLSSAAQVGTATRAGTGCGCCIPEINRILAAEGATTETA